MNDIRVELLDLPVAVKGTVMPTPEGDYLILLNSRYNEAQLREAYNHEIRHLLAGHYGNDERTIVEIEEEASENTFLDAIRKVEEQGLPRQPLSPIPSPPARTPEQRALEHQEALLSDPEALWNSYLCWLEHEEEKAIDDALRREDTEVFARLQSQREYGVSIFDEW